MSKPTPDADPAMTSEEALPAPAAVPLQENRESVGETRYTVSQVGRESAVPGGSFWNRHKTIINFWLDGLLLVLFLGIAWELSILRLAFPKGAGEQWRLLGHTAADWQDLSFVTFCVFAAGIVLHIMLHWSWIVATIQTRILRGKATRDDGSHTMIGVGVLFVLIHLLAASILWARWAMVEIR